MSGYADRVRCTSCANGSGPNGCTDCLNTGQDFAAFAGGIDQALNDAYAEGRKDERETVNLGGLLDAVRQLPFLNASETDGEEADGTPRHYRNRRYVSLTKLERLLRERLGGEA